jgi:hypothetical protein
MQSTSGISDAKKPETTGIVANMVCEALQTNSAYNIYLGQDGIGMLENGNLRIKYDGMSTDPTTFQNAMDGINLVYELATPTSISTTPTSISLLNGVNNVWSECSEDGAVIGDAEQDLEYLPNNSINDLYAKFDELGDLAYVDKGSGSSKFLREDGTWQSVTSGVSGVKGDSETDYRTGNVNITKANIGLGNVDNTADANKSVASATTATTASKLTNTSKIGDTNKPVYFTANGIPEAINYTIEKSVPSNAVFTDNNTTYTFANGTNGFTVTPSGGSAQTVTVTPSITNNVTGSGTNGYIAKWNGTNTVTNGPAFGSTTTTYLNNAGNWATPPDTKNTAGSTDTSSKIFLVGATSQAANPQTYSDNEVYATSGILTTKSVQVGGGSATMQYNSTTQAIDFIFT